MAKKLLSIAVSLAVLISMLACPVFSNAATETDSNNCISKITDSDINLNTRFIDMDGLFSGFDYIPVETDDNNKIEWEVLPSSYWKDNKGNYPDMGDKVNINRTYTLHLELAPVCDCADNCIDIASTHVSIKGAEVPCTIGENGKTVCVDIDSCKFVTPDSVSLSRDRFTYTGKAIKPKVIPDGISADNYTVTYGKNVTCRTNAYALVTGKINPDGISCFGQTKLHFEITKATPSIKITSSSRTVKYSAVKKASTRTSALYVSGVKENAKKTFTKVSGSSRLTVGKTTGKITVKKGTKKGKYTIKVKVSTASTSNYKSASTTKTIKVYVK